MLLTFLQSPRTTRFILGPFAFLMFLILRTAGGSTYFRIFQLQDPCILDNSIVSTSALDTAPTHHNTQLTSGC